MRPRRRLAFGTLGLHLTAQLLDFATCLLIFVKQETKNTATGFGEAGTKSYGGDKKLLILILGDNLYRAFVATVLSFGPQDYYSGAVVLVFRKTFRSACKHMPATTF